MEVLVDTGNGMQTFEISATRAGRRVEVTNVRGVVEVSEVTRSGQPVRTGRFMGTRVIALVEHPAEEDRQPSARRRADENQSSLLWERRATRP